MPTDSPHPILEQLKRQARELLEAGRNGDPKALERLRAVPRLARRPGAGRDDSLPAAQTELAREAKLSDAQHAIAIERGQESWPKLKRAIEATRPLAFQGELFLAKIRSGEAAAARRLFERHPEIARLTILNAAAAGEADFVEQALAADPRYARAVHAAFGWTPLLYAAASPLHEGDPARAAGIRRAARLLLAAGADPDSSMPHEPGEEEITALYHACAGGHTQLVEILLEAGADPNDGESLYHSAERNRRDVLELLLAHGADPSGRHPGHDNTPLHFLAGYGEGQPGTAEADEGMRWLLEHGADPNVPSGPRKETPLHRLAAGGRSPAVIGLFLDHGADPDRRRADGRNAWALAVRGGNDETARLLAARGASTSGQSAVDEWLGACLRGDDAAAGSVLASHPELRRDLAGALSPEDRGLMIQAVTDDRAASVALMARAGFDLAWESEWGGTALHHAAWRGMVAMTRRLVELGAPLDARDRRFASSPLAWCAHGSVNCRSDDEAYCAVATLLLDAGAGFEAAVNRWNEPPEALASRKVSELLRRRRAAREGGPAPGTYR